MPMKKFDETDPIFAAAASAAEVAAIPTAGPVIAAQMAAIASVIASIEQDNSSELEGQAAADEDRGPVDPPDALVLSGADPKHGPQDLDADVGPRTEAGIAPVLNQISAIVVQVGQMEADRAEDLALGREREAGSKDRDPVELLDEIGRSGADLKHGPQPIAVEQEGVDRLMGEVAVDQGSGSAGSQAAELADDDHGARSSAADPGFDPADAGTATLARSTGPEASGPSDEFEDDVEAARDDALLAGLAAAAPPVAAAVALAGAAEDAYEAGTSLAHDFGNALDDLFDPEVIVGESTFAPVPDGETSLPGSAEAREQLEATGDAIRANQAHFEERGGGFVSGAGSAREGSFGDFRQQDISDNLVHEGADTTLQLQGDIVGPGAAGANDVVAPDGANEPVTVSGAHTSVAGAGVAGPGAAGANDVLAPDGVMEPVAGASPNVAFGADPAAAASVPADVHEPVIVSGPQVSVGAASGGPAIAGHGAAGADEVVAPDGAMQPVAGLRADVAIGADPAIDLDHLPTAHHDPVAVAFGADVQLNPQPIPPGLDMQPPSPTVAGAGADVQLNPQPIPPGLGADIGEPRASAVAHTPDATDASIIIVGGTDPPVLAADAVPVLADTHAVEVADSPVTQDIASTLAADLDGPGLHSFHHDAPIEVGFTEDEFDG